MHRCIIITINVDVVYLCELNVHLDELCVFEKFSTELRYHKEVAVTSSLLRNISTRVAISVSE